MTTVKRTEHCLCGSSLTIVATSSGGLDKAFALWREHHAGDGHGPALRQQAYMARIRNDKQARKEQQHADHVNQL